MASIGRFPSHDAPFCRPEAKPKDLTPATYSVSMARVWSFGEVLRLRLRTTERGKREADARVRTRMVDSGQAGYDGPVMNDLPIPDSCRAVIQIGKNPREEIVLCRFFFIS